MVELVDAPDSKSGGPKTHGGSSPPTGTNADLAQPVEQLNRNQQVVGSSPIAGSMNITIGRRLPVVFLCVRDRGDCCWTARVSAASAAGASSVSREPPYATKGMVEAEVILIVPFPQHVYPINLVSALTVCRRGSPLSCG